MSNMILFKSFKYFKKNPFITCYNDLISIYPRFLSYNKALGEDVLKKVHNSSNHMTKTVLLEEQASEVNQIDKDRDIQLEIEEQPLEGIKLRKDSKKKGLQGIPDIELAPIPHQEITIYATELFEKPANFIGSVAELPNLKEEPDAFIKWPNKGLPEVAFLGVSNAGKSTLINSLLNTKKLAKTSKKPGHTKTINLFEVANRLVLVDMPGYGYKSRIEWGELVEAYLRYGVSSKGNLKMVYLLIESKRGFKSYDKMILELLDSIPVPYQIIITKADKLNPNYWSENFLKPSTSPLARHLIEFSKNINNLFILFIAPLQNRFGIAQLRAQILEVTKMIPSRLRSFLSESRRITQIPLRADLRKPSKKERKEFAKALHDNQY